MRATLFGSLLSAVTLLAGMLAVSLIVDPMLGLTALASLAAMSYLSFRAGRRGTAGVIGGGGARSVLGVGVLRVAPGALTPGELGIVGAYVTHLVRGGAKDLQAALAALDPVLEGYGDRPEGCRGTWPRRFSVARRSPSGIRTSTGRGGSRRW